MKRNFRKPNRIITLPTQGDGGYSGTPRGGMRNNQGMPQNNSATMAAAAAVAALNAQQQQQSTVIVPGFVDGWQKPQALIQTVYSDVGTNAAAVTVYFGNESFYNSTATNNGSGANSVHKSYGDGWSGKGYEQLYSGANEGGTPGIVCYGFTLQFTTTSTGAQAPAGLNTAAPTILYSNLVGINQVPTGIPLTQGSRNNQYLNGMMTIAVQFKMNSLAQFSWVLPVGITGNLTVNTQPMVGLG